MAVNEISGLSGQSRSSFGDRMKDEYIPAWEDHVHVGRKVNRYLMNKRGSFGLGGKRSLSSVMRRYPQSFGIALFEGDDMPTPRVGGYFQPELFSRSIYGRLRWTGHVKRAARRGDKVAWAEPMAEDLRTARVQFEINLERMLVLGIYQILATVSSFSADAGANGFDRVTFYGRDARTSQSDDFHKFGVHYLREFQSFSHVAASGGAVQQDGSLAQVNTDGNTNEIYWAAISTASDTAPTADTNIDFTSLASGADPADESIIVPFRSRVNTPGAEGASRDSNFAGINGLENLVARNAQKGYVYGVNRADVPSLEAFVDANGSNGVRPFTEDRITYGCDKISDDGTGDDPDVILCHRSIRREYVKETKGDRRFDPVLTKKGFAAKLVFQSGDVLLPIETSRDVQPGLMWILESEGFGWFSEADLQLVDEGERFVANKDATEQIVVKSGNLAARKPCNNARIDDIQFSVFGLTDLA